MKTHSLASSCLALAVTLGGSAVADEAAKPKFQLPDDPKAAVIVFDYKGGFTPPRLNQKPMFSILADGSVLMPARFQGQVSHEGKISVKQIHELLTFIESKKFFEYDAAVVKKKLAQGGPRPQIADAPTTVIRVTLKDKQKEVSHYALGIGVDGVPELQAIAEIRTRLMRVQSVVQLGGDEEVKKWLKQANAELKTEFPNVRPLTEEDLQSGGKRANGSLYVSFSRRIPAPDNDPRKTIYTSVFINKTADTTKVNVSHREP